jgi:hypothetical protein
MPTTTAPASTIPAATAPTPPTFPPYTSALYADPAHWICRGDATDLCNDPLEVAEVAADGTVTMRVDEPAADPPADCFYVYPTTSEDATTQSDLVPGTESITVLQQAARFNTVCRVWAPVYRSVTLLGLFGGSIDRVPITEAWPAAYDDVLDAWRHYLANDNDGRPVVLLGHSQGSGHLTRLLREEIDPSPEQRSLIVSAMVLGTNFAVPAGADVGIDTQHMPLCRDPRQTGCIVTYATFLADEPPGPNAVFGRPRGFPLGSGEGVSGCTHPGALGGGSAPLDAVLPSGDWVLPGSSTPIDARWVSVPGLLVAECLERDGAVYLGVTVQADPSDPRADVLPFGSRDGWGLHMVDVNIALGSLITLAAQQISTHPFR